MFGLKFKLDIRYYLYSIYSIIYITIISYYYIKLTCFFDLIKYKSMYSINS